MDTNSTKPLILASASPHRKAMLTAAGLDVAAIASQIDERAVEQALGEEAGDGEILAAILAEAKASDVSSRYPGALVIGCDQTLTLDGEIFHKPADMDEARANLLRLAGRTHQLNSAIALAIDGKTVWRHTSIARMAMRPFDAAYAGRYLARVGVTALTSVGAYQIEGEGVQLFEAVDGDFFTIVGLPLLPLLAELRKRGAIDG